MATINGYPIWWIKTMEFLRTVSGTVYVDQLERYTVNMLHCYNDGNNYAINGDVVSFLNSFSKEKSKAEFIKTHPLTGEVYTVPYMRRVLDVLVFKNNPEYSFNKYLYQDSFNFENERANLYPIENCDNNLFDKIVSVNNSNNTFNIDFSVLDAKEGLRVCVKDFDIEEAYRYALSKHETTEKLNLESVNAKDVVFLGESKIGFIGDIEHIPVVTQMCDFSGATFECDVNICNLIFSNSSVSNSGDADLLNFRNSRFFGSVKLRNVNFCDTNVDNRVTFEDARISVNFEIINTDFGHASLYCFQTVFGDFLALNTGLPQRHLIVLNNIRFEDDAHIDFVDSELDNGFVKISNSSLPQIDLCFFSKIEKSLSVCPNIKLKIYNCDVTKNLNISNVSELSFEKSRNFGRIIADDRWCNVDTELWNSSHKHKYRKKSKGLGRTSINNKLLLAVYNYESSHSKSINGYYKAKDFVMLKENFLSQGMYDEEDTAFILYMEFKPYIDSYNDSGDLDKIRKKKSTSCLYNILYSSGKYGISPTRVIKVLTLTIFTFTILYFLASIRLDGHAFSIGNVILSQDNVLHEIIKNLFFKSSDIEVEKLGVKFIGSFLYSLESIIPFISQFEPFDTVVMMLSVLENSIGTFLTGYFSVAVVRKTLR